MNDQEKRWFAVNVSVASVAIEAVEFAFNKLEALGTAINQLRKANADTVTVTGYFNVPPNDKILSDELHDALRIYSLDPKAIQSITHDEVESTDWLAEWKKHWQPTTVGRFVIAPPWSDVADTGKIIIRIEPNMAFGTGTHETTQLCLKAIGQRYAPFMSVLDVGTGTGILAIAAAKLVAESTQKSEIFACDIDEDSVKIARENAAANYVGERIIFSCNSIDSTTPVYDFVCANLTLEVITPLLPLLIEKSRRLLLLSGILVEQEDVVIAELLKSHISNFQIERAGEWIAVLIDSAEARMK